MSNLSRTLWWKPAGVRTRGGRLFRATLNQAEKDSETEDNTLQQQPSQPTVQDESEIDVTRDRLDRLDR